jgi:hypothetical protein
MFHRKVTELYLNYDYDADADYFAKAFEVGLPYHDGLSWQGTQPRILEVGANEEPLANILAIQGYDVVGVDWRPYIPEKRLFANLPLNFQFIQGDFNAMTFSDQYDAVFSLSTIEHFGLGPYGDPKSPDGDIVAMRLIKAALKPSGKAFITIPVGIGGTIFHRDGAGRYILDERIYNPLDLFSRIVQDFYVEKMQFFASDVVEGRFPRGTEITPDIAFRQADNPDASVLLVLRK